MNLLKSILLIGFGFNSEVFLLAFQMYYSELKRKVKKLVRTKKDIREEGLNIDDFSAFNDMFPPYK